MNTGGARCPACREPFAPGDRFCEACGGDLPTIDALCAACRGVVDDGYCANCGLKKPAPRDHIEESWPGIGMVTDKGKRHWRNEDAFGVEPRPDFVAAVVCDGVSSTVRADDASEAAVGAALPVLARAGASALADSYTAARDAVLALQWTPLPDMGPPSCTYLGAVVTNTLVSFTSFGDCRAYWIDADGAVQLNEDDSVAAEAARRGELTHEQAVNDPGYHVVTRWIAADADPAWRPNVSAFPVSGPGRVVLCSDGLWNYTYDPDALVAAIGDQRDDALTIAQRLTQHALDSGGLDNIAVIVIDIPLAGGASQG